VLVGRCRRVPTLSARHRWTVRARCCCRRLSGLRRHLTRICRSITPICKPAVKRCLQIYLKICESLLHVPHPSFPLIITSIMLTAT
jgi:hypothetical protein